MADSIVQISEEEFFHKIQSYLQKQRDNKADALKVTLQPEGLASLSLHFSTQKPELKDMFDQLQTVRHLKIEGGNLQILSSRPQRHVLELPLVNLALFPFLEGLHLLKAHSFKMFGLSSLRHCIKRVTIRDSIVSFDQFFSSCLNDAVSDSTPWKSLNFCSFRGGSINSTGKSLLLLNKLTVLDLSYNCLSSIEDYFNCVNLVDLNLGFNRINNLSDINLRIGAISTLILSNNKIKELGALNKLFSLKILDLSFNLITAFSEVQSLKRLPELSSLSLIGNPLTFAENYRINTLMIFSGQIEVGPFALDELIATSNTYYAACFHFKCD
jgi:hypothetical protein